MKRIVAILFSVLFSLTLFADAPTITAQAPNLVGQDEQFNVTFVVEGDESVTDFQWTPGSDFQLVWGPQRGSSTSISIINGKRTKSTQSSFTYILMPKSTGSFQLPAATVKVGGKMLTSRSLQVEVVRGQDSSAPAQSRSDAQQPGNVSGSVPSEDIFLRLSLSRRNAVVGEPVVASLKLYQRVNIAGFEDARFPTFTGFWSQETNSPSQVEFHRESVGDQIYNAAVLREWTIIPQRAGDLEIEPAELVCLVNVRAPHASTGSIFDSFFQDDYQTVRKRVTTPSMKIHVRSLPAGAPASFCGGVGQYRMKVELSRDSLKTHEAASVRVTVTGRGNIALLEAPKISFPPDFESYDVKSSDVSGGKMFEYPFIPRSHGDFVIGPVEYSYYDSSAGKYVTLTSSEMHLRVAKGAETVSSSGTVVAAPAGRKDVKDLGSDIRYIETSVPAFCGSPLIFAGSLWFWIVTVLVLIAAVTVYLSTRKLRARRADVVGTKNRGAAKMARKRLSAAENFLAGGIRSAFYEELHKALLGFVSDKLNIDMADLSKENISAALASKGVPSDTCAAFTGLLDECEYARFAPSAEEGDMKKNYEHAVGVISDLDSRLGSRRNAGHGAKKGAVSAILALLLALPSGLRAEDARPDSLWNAGIEAYNAGDYTEAVRSWKTLADAGYCDAELYYNLACASFKNDDIAGAVLGFERALRMRPGWKDARFNLQFVSEHVQDRIDEVPEFFLRTWMRSLCYSLSSNAWTAIFFAALLLALAALLAFLLSDSSVLRKTGFFSSIVIALLCLLSASFAFKQKSDFQARDRAVVVAPVSAVKSSPGVSSTDLFVLHEGTEVRILETVGGWMNIELRDGRQGWMQSGDGEVI